MTRVLEQIEADITHLSLTDQLWLMERLARLIRERTRPALIVQESDLIAMAHDPAMQQELQNIDAEFAVTESDGLDSAP
jgi:hypothetical protein